MTTLFFNRWFSPGKGQVSWRPGGVEVDENVQPVHSGLSKMEAIPLTQGSITYITTWQDRSHLIFFSSKLLNFASLFPFELLYYPLLLPKEEGVEAIQKDNLLS